MRPSGLTTGLAALMLSASLAQASSLVLNDGQVIKGTEITRKGDAYLLTMEGGNIVSFPVALVKELRLEEAEPPVAPPGFDYSGPKQLAGPVERASQDRKDALKLLGPPAQWTKDVIDPTWTPTSAYDPDVDVLAASRATWSKSAVDTTWVPTSGFDMRKDVFAGRGATWVSSIVDTTWSPKDGFGFKPLWPSAGPPAVLPVTPSVPIEAVAPAPPDLASHATPWTCAEALFAKNGHPASMSVKTMNDRTAAVLGIPLYEAQGKLEGVSRRAIFTIVTNQCRMVGGDADTLTGLNLPVEHAMAQDAASFNIATSAHGGPRVPVGVDKIDYALAFVSLTDPAVSGSRSATLTRIENPTELHSIIAKTPVVCNVSKSQRRKEERAATASFYAPKLEAEKDGDVVTFLTWSSAGGVLARNRVVLARDGVSAKRTVVASHLGAHTD